MICEIWKRIDGHDNSFEISSCGKVRSLDRMVKYSDGRERFYAGRELRLQADKRGYMTVDIFKDGKRKNEKVHRLVAKSFVDGFSEIKNTVNHVDGDKKNNSYENLEWCSAKENAKHAKETGLMKSCDKHYKSKFTNEEVLKIRRECEGGRKQRSVAREYGVCETTIHQIVKGKTYKFVGGAKTL